MEKATIISAILDVCKDMGLNYETKVKTSTWNADVVVDHDNYKVAFNVCKFPRNVEATHKAMHDERVCGCWLLMPSDKSSYIESSLPCFHIISHTDMEFVYLNSTSDNNSNNRLELSAFVHSIIDGKIRFAEQAEINKVELRFYKENCWKCHKENDIYFVNRLFSQKGVDINRYHLVLEENIDYHPSVSRSFKKYAQMSGETFTMGDIKPRYSRTCREAYLSFGCAQCDSLFGDFWHQRNLDELMSDTDSLRKAVISLDEPIKMPVRCWYKVNS